MPAAHAGSALAPPPRVTALPAGVGTDGFEVRYVADATNGIIWSFRYNAASASAYKWEFVGGPPLAAVVETASAVTPAATEVDLSGPSLTLPALAGDFIISHCYTGKHPTGGNYVRGVLSVAGAVITSTYLYAVSYLAGYDSSPASAGYAATGLAASSVVKMRYYSSAGTTAEVRSRRLAVTPIRVG